MRKPEQQLWDVMKAHNPSDQEFWMQRVENGVGDGMPDVHIAPRGRKEFWVELKTAQMPKRASTRVFSPKNGVRASQENWHLQYNLFGGTSFILALVPKIGHGWRDSDLLLIPGKHVEQINEANAAKLLSLSLPVTSWKTIYQFWGVM